MTEDNPKEGIDLRPDGGIHLWLDGKKHRLRRPRGREFRKLREDLQDRLDDINESLDESVRWAQDLLAERGTDTEPLGRLPADARAEDRRRSREIRDMTETAVKSWWVTAVATLGVDADELDADELPPWLSDSGTATKAVDHWRSVPSLSGAP